MPNHALNELDQIIDRALASYVDGQPSPNLEHRVLESVHQATHRRRRIWQFAIATPLLAAPVILLVARHADRRLPATQPIVATVPARPILTTTPLTTQMSAPAPTKKSPAFPENKKRPRPTTVPAEPAPSYFTVNETTLVTLAHQKPEHLQALFAREEGPREIAPDTIDEIDIKPIATEPLL